MRAQGLGQGAGDLAAPIQIQPAAGLIVGSQFAVVGIEGIAAAFAVSVFAHDGI